jgi:hypothetical protein
MTAAILCPGPSLANLEVIPACDVSIAVNRAALRFACDWWAALDAPFVRANRPLGSPLLFTRRENRIDAAVYFEDVYPFPNQAQSYFTFPGALSLAAHLGATRIDVYGCDWAVGQPDFDGRQPDEANRSAARFAREREHFDQLTHWLNAKGIEVIRHGLDG